MAGMGFPYAVPMDGFTGHGQARGYTELSLGTSHNVVSTSRYAFPLGTIIQYYNSSLGGPGACIYLTYSVGAETLAAGYPVGVDEGVDGYLQVTGDQSTIGDDGPTAIALSAMTTTYLGWFWCWGVPPDFYTSSSAKFSATTCTTDDAIVAGKGFEMAFSTTDGIITVATGAALTKMGYALADDGGASTDMANLWLFNTWISSG